MDNSKQVPQLRIGLIDDYSPQLRAHVATPQALRLAAAADTEIEEEWLATETLGDEYHALFDDGRLRVTGVDAEGATRVIELNGHPFFVATLFQPELSARSGTKHPLVAALVQTAAEVAAPLEV